MASQFLSSQSPYLLHAAGILGSAPLLIGINALVQPRKALEVFEFDMPKAADGQKLAESLLLVYGARDVFMGAAMGVAYYYGHRPILGWMLLGGAGITFADGAVSRRQIGRGEWKHWSILPILAVTGAGLLGWFDPLLG